MLSMDFRKRSLLIALLPFLLVLGGCGAKDSPDPYRLPESLEGPNWFVIDKTGRKVFDVPHDYKIGEYHEGLCRFIKVQDGKRVTGFLDSDGKIAIEPRYSYCSDFFEGRAFSTTTGRLPFEHSQIIDRSGAQVVDIHWRSIQRDSHTECCSLSASLFDLGEWFRDRMSRRRGMRLRRNFGLVDREGKEVAPCVFESAGYVGEGLYSASRDSITTLFDLQGRKVAEVKAQISGRFNEGLAVASQDRKFPGSALVVSTNPNGLAALRPKFGFVDKKGSVVVPFQFECASPFSDGLASVGDETGSFFIDKTGKDVFGRRFEASGSFSNGLAPVKTNGLWGFVDRTGTMVIEPRFSAAESFEDGSAVCAVLANKDLCNLSCLATKNYFDLDYWQDPVCQPTVGRFGRIEVRDCFRPRLKFGMLNTSGDYLVEPKYDNIQTLSNGLRKVELAGRFGFIDSSGTEVIEPSFVLATKFSGERAVATLDPQVQLAEFDPVVDLRLFLDSRDPETVEFSLKSLSKVIEMVPESPHAHANRGWLNFRLERYKDALSDFQSALRLKPLSASLRFGRGCSLLKLGRWAEAESDLEYCAKPAVSSPFVLTNRPMYLHEYDQPDFSPQGASYLLDMARAEQGRFEMPKADPLPVIEDHGESISLLQRLSAYPHVCDLLVERFPIDLPHSGPSGRELEKSIDSLSKTALSLEKEGDRDAYAARVIHSELGMLLRSRIWSKRRRFEIKGLEQLMLAGCREMKSMDRDPFAYSIAQLELADFYSGIDSPRAEEIYKSVMSRPGSDLFGYRYASYLAKQGRLTDARRAFNMAAHTGMARWRLINFLSQQGETFDRESLLSRHKEYGTIIQDGSLPALPVGRSGSAEECYELCRTANDFGQVNAARFYLDKSLGQDRSPSWREKVLRYRRCYLPANRVALDVIGLYSATLDDHIRLFEFEGPRDVLLKCIKQAPEYPHPYAELVNLYTDVGSYSDAEALLKVAVKQHPNFVPLRMAAGKLYLDMGRKDKAVEAYKTALKLDPTVELAQREVKRLGK